MKHALRVLVAVLVLTTVSFAGNWSITIPGVGPAKTFFGFAQSFDNDAGEVINQYAGNVPNPFLIFVIVSEYSTSSGTTLYQMIRMTRPDGTQSEHPRIQTLRYANGRFWFWNHFDLSDQPAGEYVFDILVNNVKVGGLTITRH